MKTAYFTPGRIKDQALLLFDQMPDHLRAVKSTINPEKSALLILDMQSYFLEPSAHAFIPSAPAIVPGLTQLASKYFALDLPVIFTQHLNSAQDAGSMATWWNDIIKIEDPLAAIIPEFDYSNRYVIPKTQYDAFYQTDLKEHLTSRDVSQVVVSGVMTHLCCETTARSAFMHGFEVFFLIDGTATYNKEHHLATLLNLSHGFATPILVSQIQVALEDLAENRG